MTSLQGSEKVCPEILRPNEDGECYKDQYPFKFKTHNGEDCCYKLPLKFRKKLLSKANEAKAVVRIGRQNFKDERRIVKKSEINVDDYDNIEQFMSENDIQCKDIFCNTYGIMVNGCEDGNENVLSIEDIKEQGINRAIPLNKDICDNINLEMPSEAWTEMQIAYFENMDKIDYEYLTLYTLHGDSILNTFIRNNYALTEDNAQYIMNNYVHFKFTLENFINNGGEYLEDYVMEFYNSLMSTILNAPALDKDVVFYRGISDKDFFDAATDNSVYQNNGFLSTTGHTKVALSFSNGYMNRIVVPKGHHCVLLSNSHFLREFEFLLPDKTKFYISKNFEQRKMFSKPNNSYENIQVNEIILINEENIKINSKEKKLNIKNIRNEEEPYYKIINLIKTKNLEDLKSLMINYMKIVEADFDKEHLDKKIDYQDIMGQDYDKDDETVKKALYAVEIHEIYNMIISSVDGESPVADDYYIQNKDKIKNALDIKPYIEYVNSKEYSSEDEERQMNVIKEFDRIAKILEYPEDILSKNLKMLDTVSADAEELPQNIKDTLFDNTKNGVNDISYGLIAMILEYERDASPNVYGAFKAHREYDDLIKKGNYELTSIEYFIEDLQKSDKNILEVKPYIDYVNSDDYNHPDKDYVIRKMNKINKIFGNINKKEEKILKLFKENDTKAIKQIILDYTINGVKDVDYEIIEKNLKDDGYDKSIQNIMFMHRNYDSLIRNADEEIENFILELEDDDEDYPNPFYIQREDFKNALDIQPYLDYVNNYKYVHPKKDYVIEQMNSLRKALGFTGMQQRGQVGQGRVQQYGGMWQRGGFFMTCS